MFCVNSSHDGRHARLVMQCLMAIGQVMEPHREVVLGREGKED